MPPIVLDYDEDEFPEVLKLAPPVESPTDRAAREADRRHAKLDAVEKAVKELRYSMNFRGLGDVAETLFELSMTLQESLDRVEGTTLAGVRFRQACSACYKVKVSD